jgi:hypothetical protein
MAPNFFLEAKGPDGSLVVAGRQALQNGTAGARGIHSLQSFGADETIYDGNAYTITSTYHGGQLKMYTTHPTKSQNPHRVSDYHMTQLRTFAMTDCPDGFRQGAAAYRNAGDWAKEQRDKFIEDANRQAENTTTQSLSFGTKTSSQTIISAVVAVSLESDTLADELALDEGIGRASARKRALTASADPSSRCARRRERKVDDAD